MIIFICQAYNGLGRHYEVIGQHEFVQFLKLSFIQSIVAHIVALALLKISVALSLLRLSRSKWYTYSLWALIGNDNVFLNCVCRLTRDSLCERVQPNGLLHLLFLLQAHVWRLGLVFAAASEMLQHQAFRLVCTV